MKICTKCKQEKEVEEFHKLKTSKDGYSSWCNICKKNYDEKYRKTDKIQDVYKSAIYRDRKKEYQRMRVKKDPRILMLTLAKYRAKKLGLNFNILIEDIVIPEKCPILEIPLFVREYKEGKTGFHANSPSLDKIDPLKGYVKGNIMVISMKANAMKYNATIDELLIFSKNITKIYGNRNISVYNTNAS